MKIFTFQSSGFGVKRQCKQRCRHTCSRPPLLRLHALFGVSPTTVFASQSGVIKKHELRPRRGLFLFTAGDFPPELALRTVERSRVDGKVWTNAHGIVITHADGRPRRSVYTQAPGGRRGGGDKSEGNKHTMNGLQLQHKRPAFQHFCQINISRQDEVDERFNY